jgi:hypothetical protein
MTLSAERLIFWVIHYIHVPPKKNCTKGTYRVLEDTAFFAVFKIKTFLSKNCTRRKLLTKKAPKKQLLGDFSRRKNLKKNTKKLCNHHTMLSMLSRTR